MSANPINVQPAGQVSRERLIKQAAHVWSSLNSGMFWAKVARLGLSDQEAQEALELAKQQHEEHEKWCRNYGSPSYGGWKTDRRDGRQKPMDLIPREFWG